MVALTYALKCVSLHYLSHATHGMYMVMGQKK